MTLVYFVELFELDRDAQQKKIAMFKLSGDGGNMVEIDGEHDHPAIFSIKREGIFDYKNARPGKLYPHDGMSFLENLKYYFRSGYLLATDVQKKTLDN